MKSRCRQLVLIVALLGVTGGFGCAKKAAPNSPSASARPAQVVEVTPLVRRDLAETINLVGSLQPNESAEIRPEVSGIVRSIQFEEGRKVAAGDVLLKIDDAELRAQLEQVAARFKLAELNVARSENLSQSRTIPQSDYDRARSEYAAVKAEMEVLQLRLAKTELKAPFAGIVGSRTISVGDYVTTASVITRIDDLSKSKVSFSVPERYLAKVRPGTQVRVTTRGDTGSVPQVIVGEVYFVSATIDRSIRASEVKALLEASNVILRPGMFANVELLLEVRSQVLTVPESAVLADARGIQIIIVEVKDGKQVARFVPVTTGLRARGLVEVTPVATAALPDDVSVVAAGVGAVMLYPGAPVAPKPLREVFQQP
ncbi:MAG: efflux RND transporter periplasmic adaptor subunit [Opitutaceae bacterium]|nr:efflux RND transporter periplasmic adaptor subunit [Opitutaceae bacterium]